MTNEYLDLPEGILSIDKGVICQQVNCSNGYGAGLSGIIARRYPMVEKEYRKICVLYKPEQLLGTVLFVNASKDLTVANLFAQLSYGRSRSNTIYTDYSAFESCIQQVCKSFPNSNIYVPEGIGCGLANGDWKLVSNILSKYPVKIVKKPNNI